MLLQRSECLASSSAVLVAFLRKMVKHMLEHFPQYLYSRLAHFVSNQSYQYRYPLMSPLPVLRIVIKLSLSLCDSVSQSLILVSRVPAQSEHRTSPSNTSALSFSPITAEVSPSVKDRGNSSCDSSTTCYATQQEVVEVVAGAPGRRQLTLSGRQTESLLSA